MAYCAFEAMHTRFELLFKHQDENESRRIAYMVEEYVFGLEKTISRHLAGSTLSMVNRTKDAVAVSDELFFILELCEQFRMASLGYFDIAALSSTIARPSYRMFPPTHSVQRCLKGILLDFGGFGKGYAVERIRTLLENEGVVCALVNAGDSSVLGIGAHPLGDEWRVSPAVGKECFFLRDSALSVSGRSSTGRSHILNPLTGENVQTGGDIVVTGRSALVCEALSTALYAAPGEKRDDIMKNFEDYKYLEING